jgi:hypothetical protein
MLAALSFGCGACRKSRRGPTHDGGLGMLSSFQNHFVIDTSTITSDNAT